MLLPLIFGDEEAFVRLDMSEYKEEQSLFAGDWGSVFKSGFIGEPLRTKFTALIASLKTAVTDGTGQTAYFNQSDLTDPQTGALIRAGIMNQVQHGGTSQ